MAISELIQARLQSALLRWRHRVRSLAGLLLRRQSSSLLFPQQMLPIAAFVSDVLSKLESTAPKIPGSLKSAPLPDMDLSDVPGNTFVRSGPPTPYRGGMSITLSACRMFRVLSDGTVSYVMPNRSSAAADLIETVRATDKPRSSNAKSMMPQQSGPRGLRAEVQHSRDQGGDGDLDASSPLLTGPQTSVWTVLTSRLPAHHPLHVISPRLPHGMYAGGHQAGWAEGVGVRRLWRQQLKQSAAVVALSDEHNRWQRLWKPFAVQLNGQSVVLPYVPYSYLDQRVVSVSKAEQGVSPHIYRITATNPLQLARFVLRVRTLVMRLPAAALAIPAPVVSEASQSFEAHAMQCIQDQPPVPTLAELPRFNSGVGIVAAGCATGNLDIDIDVPRPMAHNGSALGGASIPIQRRRGSITFASDGMEQSDSVPASLPGSSSSSRYPFSGISPQASARSSRTARSISPRTPGSTRRRVASRLDSIQLFLSHYGNRVKAEAMNFSDEGLDRQAQRALRRLKRQQSFQKQRQQQQQAMRDTSGPAARPMLTRSMMERRAASAARASRLEGIALSDLNTALASVSKSGPLFLMTCPPLEQLITPGRSRADPRSRLAVRTTSAAPHARFLSFHSFWLVEGWPVDVVAAATRIQSVWRGWQTRTVFTTLNIETLTLLRAARLIQRVFHSRRSHWRLCMLAGINTLLQKLSTSTHPNTLLIETSCVPALLKGGVGIGALMQPPNTTDPSDWDSQPTEELSIRKSMSLRPWSIAYSPEHDVGVCFYVHTKRRAAGQIRTRVHQPQLPPARWAGRRVGLPLWLGLNLEWAAEGGRIVGPAAPHGVRVHESNVQAGDADGRGADEANQDVWSAVQAHEAGGDAHPINRLRLSQQWGQLVSGQVASFIPPSTQASGVTQLPHERVTSIPLFSRGVQAAPASSRVDGRLRGEGSDAWLTQHFVQLEFESQAEARARAALLFAMTWSPVSRAGCELFTVERVLDLWQSQQDTAHAPDTTASAANAGASDQSPSNDGSTSQHTQSQPRRRYGRWSEVYTKHYFFDGLYHAQLARTGLNAPRLRQGDSSQRSLQPTPSPAHSAPWSPAASIGTPAAGSRLDSGWFPQSQVGSQPALSPLRANREPGHVTPRAPAIFIPSSPAGDSQGQDSASTSHVSLSTARTGTGIALQGFDAPGQAPAHPPPVRMRPAPSSSESMQHNLPPISAWQSRDEPTPAPRTLTAQQPFGPTVDTTASPVRSTRQSPASCLPTARSSAPLTPYRGSPFARGDETMRASQRAEVLAAAVADSNRWTVLTARHGAMMEEQVLEAWRERQKEEMEDRVEAAAVMRQTMRSARAEALTVHRDTVLQARDEIDKKKHAGKKVVRRQLVADQMDKASKVARVKAMKARAKETLEAHRPASSLWRRTHQRPERPRSSPPGQRRTSSGRRQVQVSVPALGGVGQWSTSAANTPASTLHQQDSDAALRTVNQHVAPTAPIVPALAKQQRPSPSPAPAQSAARPHTARLAGPRTRQPITRYTSHDEDRARTTRLGLRPSQLDPALEAERGPTALASMRGRLTRLESGSSTAATKQVCTFSRMPERRRKPQSLVHSVQRSSTTLYQL